MRENRLFTHCTDLEIRYFGKLSWLPCLVSVGIRQGTSNSDNISEKKKDILCVYKMMEKIYCWSEWWLIRDDE